MNWNLVRGLTYVAALIASLMAFFGVADFDLATGHLVIHPFNLYAAIAGAAGAISSALFTLALFRGLGAQVIRIITSLLSGGIPDRLRRAYEAKLAAENDADRLASETLIRALEIAQANRRATADNLGVRWAIGIVALALAVHLALVAFVSALPRLGWTVHALPVPMNE